MTESDEYGELNVFSEERLAYLKEQANGQFVKLCEIIKKSQAAIMGITEFLKAAESNEKSFYDASKFYVDTLKAVGDEMTKPKF